MSIFVLNLYIKLKPLISSLLWSLDHENISFRSKVIHIKLLKNTCPGFTCPGFRPSPKNLSKHGKRGITGIVFLMYY